MDSSQNAQTRTLFSHAFFRTHICLWIFLSWFFRFVHRVVSVTSSWLSFWMGFSLYISCSAFSSAIGSFLSRLLQNHLASLCVLELNDLSHAVRIMLLALWCVVDAFQFCCDLSCVNPIKFHKSPNSVLKQCQKRSNREKPNIPRITRLSWATPARCEWRARMHRLTQASTRLCCERIGIWLT